MDLRNIPPGRDPPKDIHAVIEIPHGGVPVKYEIDKTSGALFVDRFLRRGHGTHDFQTRQNFAQVEEAEFHLSLGDEFGSGDVSGNPRNPIHRGVTIRPH